MKRSIRFTASFVLVLAAMLSAGCSSPDNISEVQENETGIVTEENSAVTDAETSESETEETAKEAAEAVTEETTAVTTDNTSETTTEEAAENVPETTAAETTAAHTETEMGTSVSEAVTEDTVRSPESVSETEVTSEAVFTIPPKAEDGMTRVRLDVESIQQGPELPRGSEITSAVMVLNYYGINVDKTELLEYMPIMESPDENGYWTTPYDAYVGSPESSDGYGCYSDVIKKTIETYFEDKNISTCRVADVSDQSLYQLFDYIDSGHPVMIWATEDMERSFPGDVWKFGKDEESDMYYTWIGGEQCFVLVGYDLVADTVILADPTDGSIKEYDLITFKTRYLELLEQALILSFMS